MKTLKNVLLLNSLSSGATGILLLVDSQVIANLFHFPSPTPFIEVGAFLLVFAIIVFLVQRSKAPEKYANLISIADLLWVLISAVIVVFQIFHLSALGYLLTAAVAIWVAAMAWFQYLAVKRINQNKTILL